MNSFFIASFIGIFLLISSSYVFYRWSWKALFIFLPVIVFSFVTGGYNNELPTILAPIILGGTGGIVFNVGKSIKLYILVSSLFLAFVFSGNFYFLKNYKNIDLLVNSKIAIEKTLDNYKLPGDEKKQIISDIEKWLPIAEEIIPFTSFLYGLILSAVAIVIIKMFLYRFGKAADIDGLEFYRLNDYFIFILIFSWVVFFLADKSEYNLLYKFGFNAALISSVLYFIQAMGIIKFLLIKKGLPTFLIPITLFILLFIGIEIAIFISMILIGFGTLDLWADFRKLEVETSGKI